MMSSVKADILTAPIITEFNPASGLWDSKIVEGHICHALYSAQTPEESLKGLRNQLRISHHKMTTVPPKGEIES